MLEYLLFGVFSVLCVFTAIGVVVLRDPVRGALSLVACFFSGFGNSAPHSGQTR